MKYQTHEHENDSLETRTRLAEDQRQEDGNVNQQEDGQGCGDGRVVAAPRPRRPLPRGGLRPVDRRPGAFPMKWGDFGSSFDRRLAESGPGALFTLDADGELRLADDRTREDPVGVIRAAGPF